MVEYAGVIALVAVGLVALLAAVPGDLFASFWSAVTSALT